MAKRKIPMFTLAEERTTKDGVEVQVYLGVGYRLVIRRYSKTAIDISVPVSDVSRFTPHIHVYNDDEGTPDRVQIETVSYGSLTVKDYAELLRAMSLAHIHAEEIEERFVKAIREGAHPHG